MELANEVIKGWQWFATRLPSDLIGPLTADSITWHHSERHKINHEDWHVVYLLAGYRESAFAYAISSAGVAHSVARACSQGRLLECGCGPGITRAARRKAAAVAQLHASGNTKHQAASVNHRWKWGGCSHNLEFGVHFSKLFIDSREKAGDIQSRINLHNNQAGRLVSDV